MSRTEMGGISKQLERGPIDTKGMAPLRARALAEGWQYDYVAAEQGPCRYFPEKWRLAAPDETAQSAFFIEGRLRFFSEYHCPVSIIFRPIAVDGRVFQNMQWQVSGSVAEKLDGAAPELVLEFKNKDGSFREHAERVLLYREGDSISGGAENLSLPEDVVSIIPRLTMSAAGGMELDTLRVVLFPTADKIKILEGPLDLNSASSDELESIPGIGPVIAGRIVEYREKEGPFGGVDELQEVKGIGSSTVSDMEVYVTID